MTLYYIHDPMCSWCWAFRPAWLTIKAGLADKYPTMDIQYVLGGLAPDSDEPMTEVMKNYVRGNWEHIQEVVSDTEFNYDFWDVCEPRRSTYPACRAVIGAAEQGLYYQEPMILAIQQAYYLQAKNPSNDDVLYGCAESIGLDVELFTDFMKDLKSYKALSKEIKRSRDLGSKAGASGFPSLVLSAAGNTVAVPIDYNNPYISLEFIRSRL